MSNEELAKKLDENSKKILDNLKKIEKNETKIKENSKKIQENSCALDILRYLKKVNKRLQVIILIEAIVFAIVFIAFHL
jgi:DNA repair exonuclease SbcCD ATPase subunit